MKYLLLSVNKSLISDQTLFSILTSILLTEIYMVGNFQISLSTISYLIYSYKGIFTNFERIERLVVQFI